MQEVYVNIGLLLAFCIYLLEQGRVSLSLSPHTETWGSPFHACVCSRHEQRLHLATTRLERSGLAWSWSAERTAPLDFKFFIFPFWCSVFFLLISFRLLIIKLFCPSALPCSPTVGRGYKHAGMELYMSPSILITICTMTWMRCRYLKLLFYVYWKIPITCVSGLILCRLLKKIFEYMKS